MSAALARPAFTFTGRLRSIRYAIRGIGLMLRTQHNAQVHCAATLAACITAACLRIDRLEWVAVLVAIGAVWTAEALNTAFELLCDVASPTFHPVVERSKDVAAGAVLLSAIGSILVGVLVFGPHLMSLAR